MAHRWIDIDWVPTCLTFLLSHAVVHKQTILHTKDWVSYKYVLSVARALWSPSALCTFYSQSENPRIPWCIQKEYENKYTGVVSKILYNLWVVWYRNHALLIYSQVYQLGKGSITRGQWPYRPAGTIKLRHGGRPLDNLGGHGTQSNYWKCHNIYKN